MSDAEKLELLATYRDKYMSRFIEDPTLDFVHGVLEGYVTSVP